MLLRDKIKIIVISILVLLLATTYLLYGKDGVQMKYVSGFCLAAWLVTMFMVNKLNK